VTVQVEAKTPPMRKHRGRWFFRGTALLLVGWVGCLDWFTKVANKVTVGPVVNKERHVDIEVAKHLL
jgi:hypothetical protein